MLFQPFDDRGRRRAEADRDPAGRGGRERRRGLREQRPTAGEDRHDRRADREARLGRCRDGERRDAVGAVALARPEVAIAELGELDCERREVTDGDGMGRDDADTRLTPRLTEARELHRPIRSMSATDTTVPNERSSLLNALAWRAVS